MESFRAAVDRLSKIFVSDLLAAVRAAAGDRVAQQQKKEARPKPTRILRPSATAADAARAVVVRQFDIPVGQPRRQRRRAVGSPPVRKAAPPPPPPQPQVVKFEVVPHPERKNRRIVMTRLDNA
jgi:hypothetical protein